MSTRSPEKTNDFWRTVFHRGFGTATLIFAFTAWIILLAWLLMDYNGGFGHTRVTPYTHEYFNWHPLLMCTAWLICLPVSISSFEVLPFARHTNKNIHAAFNSLALACAVCGLSIILDCHLNLKQPPYWGHTVHSACGYTAVGFLVLTFAAGFVLYILKLGGALRGTLKPLHKRMGFFAFLMGLITICTGIEGHAEIPPQTSMAHVRPAQAMAVFVLLTALSVIFTVARFEDKADITADDLRQAFNAGNGQYDHSAHGKGFLFKVNDGNNNNNNNSSGNLINNMGNAGSFAGDESYAASMVSSVSNIPTPMAQT